MNQRIVFLDMDGVLADFAGQADVYCKEDVRSLLNRTTALTPAESALQQKLYHFADYSDSFWKSMPPMPDAQKLFEHVRGVFDDVYILSRFVPPAACPERLAAVKALKRNWFYRNICFDFPKNHVLVSPLPKETFIPLLNEGYLIDDKIENVKNWKKAGGTGLVYKNFTHLEKCLARLRIRQRDF